MSSKRLEEVMSKRITDFSFINLEMGGIPAFVIMDECGIFLKIEAVGMSGAWAWGSPDYRHDDAYIDWEAYIHPDHMHTLGLLTTEEIHEINRERDESVKQEFEQTMKNIQGIMVQNFTKLSKD